MSRINIELRRQLAEELFRNFQFAGKKVNELPWNFKENFSIATRAVLVDDGIAREVHMLRVCFDADDSIVDAYAEDTRGVSLGSPGGPFPGVVQTMDFDKWVARVEQEIGSDDVDGESYRVYYNRGLSPADAVLYDRMDNDVLVA
jgi:hypothetical protein